MGVRVAPLFVAEERFPGAGRRIQHSLAMAQTDSPSIHRILQAAKALKIKAKCPVWMENAWAHVGFPNLRVAILVMTTQDLVRAEKIRASWTPYKWTLLATSERNLEAQDDAGITTMLSQALKQIGRIK